MLPVFLAVMFFFFETWRFQQLQQTVDQAVLEAARTAIVPGSSATLAQTRATAILQSIGGDAATVTITPNPIIESTDEVTVTVELPNSGVGIFNTFFAPDYTFRSTLTLDTENKRIGRL